MPSGSRLGIDVGQVRVGLAASDPDGVLATPVATLERDLDARTDLDRIVAEVRERGVEIVYVGLPLHLSGTEGVAGRLARDYAATLHLRLHGLAQVRLVDERLTTVDAHRALRGSGVATRQHRSRVDQVAAVILLQTALDAERSTGRPAGTTVGGRKPRAARSGNREEVCDP